MKRQNYNFSMSGFSSHCKALLEDILSQSAFQDVTLVSDDQKFIKTHRIVLGASSEYFRNIFSLNTQHQSFIVLKGISHQILESIVSFIYLGESSVPQESVKDFIETAKFLKIKGIFEESEEAGEELKEDVDSTDEGKSEEQSDKSKENLPEDNMENDLEKIQEILLARQNEPIEINLDDEEEEIEKREDMIDAGTVDIEDDIVELIDDPNNGMLIDTEVEAHFCDKCDFECSESGEYQEHMRTEHANDIKCKECSFYAKDRLSLKEHLMNTHNGISCNNCCQKFSNLTLLRRHVLSNDDCMSKLLN